MAVTKQEADAVLGVGEPFDVEGVAFVAALRAGRRGAFERLVVEYQSQLYSMALRIVQDREDARDVVQEAFIKAFRALPETRGRLHLRAWLYRITINASYDHLRACKRRPVPVEDAALEQPALVDEAEQAELSRMFAQTLRALPRRQQVALLLKDVHGLPHSEIAEALGISRGSAEVLLFRARSGFRRRFMLLSDAGSEAARCGFAERQAVRAVGGGLPPSRHRQLLEHARTCPDCRRTLEGIGGDALGLAIAFPLVGMSGGTAAAAALASAVTGVAGGCGAGAAGAGAAAGVSAGGSATGAVAAGSAAAGSMASTGSAAVASGIVAKLGALAGMKTAAAVVASTCVVTAGGVAGVEIVQQDRPPASDDVALVATPAAESSVALAGVSAAPPAAETGALEVATPCAAPTESEDDAEEGEGLSDEGTCSPSGSPQASPLALLGSPSPAPSPSASALAAEIVPTVEASVSPSPSAITGLGMSLGPSPECRVQGGSDWRPEWRRSPRATYAEIVRRWRAAGLQQDSIRPWAGTRAWAEAVTLLNADHRADGNGRADGSSFASASDGGTQAAPVVCQSIVQVVAATEASGGQASTLQAGPSPNGAPEPSPAPVPCPEAPSHTPDTPHGE